MFHLNLAVYSDEMSSIYKTCINQANKISIGEIKNNIKSLEKYFDP